MWLRSLWPGVRPPLRWTLFLLLVVALLVLAPAALLEELGLRVRTNAWTAAVSAQKDGGSPPPSGLGLFLAKPHPGPQVPWTALLDRRELDPTMANLRRDKWVRSQPYRLGDATLNLSLFSDLQQQPVMFTTTTLATIRTEAEHPASSLLVGTSACCGLFNFTRRLLTNLALIRDNIDVMVVGVTWNVWPSVGWSAIPFLKGCEGKPQGDECLQTPLSKLNIHAVCRWMMVHEMRLALGCKKRVC